MAVHDVLHLVAVGLTAFAACAHPGWRRHAGPSGLIATVLMLVAMVDVAYVAWVHVMVWTALLLAAGVVLAGVRSTGQGVTDRPGLSTDGRGRLGDTTHDSLGLVAMAALLPLMHATPLQGVDPVGHVGGHGGGLSGGHGSGLDVLTVVVLAVATGHVLGSFAIRRGHAERSGWASRGQHVLMGVATACMAAAVLV